MMIYYELPYMISLSVETPRHSPQFFHLLLLYHKSYLPIIKLYLNLSISYVFSSCHQHTTIADQHALLLHELITSSFSITNSNDLQRKY